MALTDVTDGSRVIQQGMMPYKITFESSSGTETIRQGDLVGWDADGGQWEKVDADAKVYADFVAGDCGKCDVWMKPTGQVGCSNWDFTKEIVISETLKEIIIATLKKMNDDKKLEERHISIYDKFVGKEEE